MTPMYRPGTAAVIDDAVAAEADFMRVTAISAVQVAVVANPAGPVGIVRGRALPCAGDPDLFFAESPDDVELAKSLCVDCPVRAQCLTGAIERREPWGVWGGELFLRGEVVPRKRARGRPRKSDVAA
jgi:WhiB family transcriptional regulator, redox-sensing transcriptional regulator